MPLPPEVEALISRFRGQISTYRAAPYNEAQLRVDFIDPLFRALGWDVGNTKNLSLTYREVLHEESLEVGGSSKAPDYSFRIGGDRKFFVEAKKPAVNIATDPGPAFQVRRYAWSAKLPISVVTDFEEFAVYDCRDEPTPEDGAATARLMYFGFEELGAKWDELEQLLGYTAVLDGSLEVYAESIRVKRGTSEVDAVFLAELERWRSALATDIARRNPALTRRQLNFAVQQTIDRIVFLRIGEDRGIEPYGQLRSIRDADADLYRSFAILLRRADERYNSGLFHFRDEAGRPEPPDDLTLDLDVGDDVFRGILRRLYYPESPYEFSVLPTEILGHVYEQFLGRVISLTEDHEAAVEEKPEVRKAGGVYYTPTPIVDFIVKTTLAPLLADKTPEAVAGQGRSSRAHPLRILDPACGSGSFLIGVYDYLLRWYQDAYSQNPDRWSRGRSPRLRPGPGGEWYLTITERKNILLRHIYGVDIDPQAVEVTMLSLLLKVLEGESAEALAAQLQLFHERALPDLALNVKCGNSLIEPDLYDDEQLRLLDEEERVRINVFDWRREFEEVFRSTGGFDAVLGNPPYLDSETMTQFTPQWRAYCTAKYQAASGNWDVFCVFIERALELCRPGGRHAFIVPNKLGSTNYSRSIRQVIASTSLQRVRDYTSIPVFPVAVYPIVYSILKESPDPDSAVSYERMVQVQNGAVAVDRAEELPRARYFPSDGAPWPIFADIHVSSPVERLAAEFAPLDTIVDVHGSATVSEAYEMRALITDRLTENLPDQALRVVNSGTIDRYVTTWGQKRMRYLGASYLRPVIELDQQSKLPPTRLAQATKPKIIIAGMTKTLEAMVDLEGRVLAAKSTTVVSGKNADLLWLLGILNSRLIAFYYLTVFGGDRLQGGYLRIGPPQIRTIPIPEHRDGLIDFELRDHVAVLLDAQAQRQSARTVHERTVALRQVEAADERINAIVYRLYGLSSEEQLAVEASNEPLAG